jgi:hypothetical protein
MAEQTAPAEKPDASEYKTFQRKNGSVAKIKRKPKATAAAAAAEPAKDSAAKSSSGGAWLVGLGVVGGVAIGLAILNAFTSGSSPAQSPAA